ncbi:AEC family transporter [Rhodobacteraceae bacterium M382]|nr:AEC family transporter [Rhodobacteraceae bacterium M382]
MNLVLTVLEIVAPVFLLAGIGFTWVKLGFEYRLQFVTRLAMTLAVPCLIFVALMQTEIDRAALGRFALAGLAGYGALTVVFIVIVRILRLERRTFLSPLIFGNTGNLGVPLCLFAFGTEGLGYAIVMLALSAVYSFTYGIYLVAGRGSALKIVKEPMVWATLAGAVFLWQGWETPKFLTNTMDLIGQMAIPLMLLTLGVAVARLTPSKIIQAFWLSAMKVVVCALIGWGVGWIFDLGPTAMGVLVLELATPVAVTSYLLAEKYGADAESVAGMVVVSTLMSVASLPVLLGLLL